MTRSNNIAASIHQRLLNKARNENRPFNELLQYYANERFIYRLGESTYCDLFVLKGAMVFLAWRVPFTRPTRDMDLLGFTENSIEKLERIVQVICSQPEENDGIIFDPASVAGENIQEEANYQGIRINFLASLGKAKIHMRLDVGFGDIVTPSPHEMVIPTILEHINRPHIRAYPPETVIAEKFHAIVVLGMINSRMKDFYDLWFITKSMEFDFDLLSKAIKNTFQQRNSLLPNDIPSAFSMEFAARKKNLWVSFLSKNRIENLSENLAEITQDLSTFFKPFICSSEIIFTHWLPTKGWINDCKSNV